MRCPKCNEYIPDGITFTTCPQCSCDFKAEPPVKKALEEKNLEEQGHAEIEPSPLKVNPQSKKKAVLFLVLLIALPLAIIYFQRNPLTHHSYYIDSDPIGHVGVPENRTFVADASFFRLLFYYPADMYSPIGGHEVFLQPSGATHYSNLAVVAKKEFRVRFRVKSITLKDKSGKLYAHSNYHVELTRDIVNGQQQAIKDKRKALEETTAMVPRVDFSPSSSSEGLFYGYSLPKPPADLLLSLEIEVYTIDGRRKQTIKELVELKRVKSDPHDWIKRKMKK